MDSVAGGKLPKRFAIRSPASSLANGGTACPADVRSAQRMAFFGYALHVKPAIYWSLFPTNVEHAGMALPDLDASQNAIRGWRQERIDVLNAWLASRGTTFEQFIRDWQERYRLFDGWCADCAMATIMDGWPDEPMPAVLEGAQLMGIMTVVPFVTIPAYEVAMPESERWAVGHELWEAVEDRVLAHLREQRARIEIQHREVKPDYDRPIPRRNPWHMLWLAEYWIGRTSPYRLALEYWPELRDWEGGKDHLSKTRAIYAGIHSAANDIELTLP